MGSGCLVRNYAQRRWSLKSRRLGTVRQQTSLGTAFHSELLMLANAFVLCVRAIAEVSRAVHVTSGIDTRLLLWLGSSKHRLAGEHPILIEEQNERTSTSSHKSSRYSK